MSRDLCCLGKQNMHYWVSMERGHDIQRNDIQHNDTQLNDTQHNDTQHKGLICYAQHK
jgi:hypothetical protein